MPLLLLLSALVALCASQTNTTTTTANTTTAVVNSTTTTTTTANATITSSTSLSTEPPTTTTTTLAITTNDSTTNVESTTTTLFETTTEELPLTTYTDDHHNFPSATPSPAESLTPTTTTTSSLTFPTTPAATRAPATPAPTRQSAIHWPQACDSCGGDSAASVCEFVLPSAARREPFVCQSARCLAGAGCALRAATGGSCTVFNAANVTDAVCGNAACAGNQTAATDFNGLVCDAPPARLLPLRVDCGSELRNATGACELCAPTAPSCTLNAELANFCEPFSLCGTPDTYCLTAGSVVSGSLRCMPVECLVCGGDVASCVLEVSQNRSAPPRFAGCAPSEPTTSGALLRYLEPDRWARWRTARLRLKRAFDRAAIQRDLVRLAAALGGSSKHVRLLSVVAHRDDALGDPALRPNGSDAAAGAPLQFCDAVVQLPSSMLYNLEALLQRSYLTAARELELEFGLVAMERTDDPADLGTTASAATLAASVVAMLAAVAVPFA